MLLECEQQDQLSGIKTSLIGFVLVNRLISESQIEDLLCGMHVLVKGTFRAGINIVLTVNKFP